MSMEPSPNKSKQNLGRRNIRRLMLTFDVVIMFVFIKVKWIRQAFDGHYTGNVDSDHVGGESCCTSLCGL